MTSVKCIKLRTNWFQTLGFPNQFAGLNVDNRLKRSPLSHGLQEGWEEPRAEPHAPVLNEIQTGCELIRDTEPALDPWPWPNQSVLPALIAKAGDDAPAELRK